MLNNTEEKLITIHFSYVKNTILFFAQIKNLSNYELFILFQLNNNDTLLQRIDDVSSLLK